MKTIVLGAFATALFASAASAAPLNPASLGSAEVANVDQVRLVCNEYGRCYRTRGPRYVQRYYGGDDGYVVTTAPMAGPATTIAATAITAVAQASVSASAPGAGELGKGRSLSGPFDMDYVFSVMRCPLLRSS